MTAVSVCILPLDVVNKLLCPLCGVWTCSKCGWKRTKANMHFENHHCHLCNGTEGTLRGLKHHRGWHKKHASWKYGTWQELYDHQVQWAQEHE